MILLSPCFSPLINENSWGMASNYSKSRRLKAVFQGSMRLCEGHLDAIIIKHLFFCKYLLNYVDLFFNHDSFKWIFSQFYLLTLFAVVGVDPLFGTNWELNFVLFSFFLQNSSAWSWAVEDKDHSSFVCLIFYVIISLYAFCFGFSYSFHHLHLLNGSSPSLVFALIWVLLLEVPLSSLSSHMTLQEVHLLSCGIQTIKRYEKDLWCADWSAIKPLDAAH